MWTCQVVKNGKTYLCRHLSANDYYDEGKQVVGQWAGKASRILGIEGQDIHAGDAHFEKLRTNVHPIGGPLTQRTGEERRAFFDFQISAPKSVSIIAVTFGDDRLRTAHEEAVTASFQHLEKFASRRERSGEAVKGKGSTYTGNLVSARFTHDSSRNLDAQLHTHVVTANATYDEGKKIWYALENGEMFKAVGYAGRIYQAELAMRVKALGYEIVEDRENGKIRGFEISGVTEEDRLKQSTRRIQIEAAIEDFKKKKGRLPSAAETHVIAVETRSKKLAEISTEEVRKKQLDKYDPLARSRLEGLIRIARATALPSHPMPVRNQLAQEAVNFAINHRFERESVLSFKEIVTTALEENLGLLTHKEVYDATLENKELVDIKSSRQGPIENTLITTRENLNSEYQTIKLVNLGRNQFEEFSKNPEISRDLAPDQRKAVTRILNSKDAVMALRGPAGTGKTFTLKEIDRILSTSGKTTIFITPTHAAKSVLNKDGFKNTETVSQFIANLAKTPVDLTEHVVVVDEAGMLSSKQGFLLLEQSLKRRARVILVGDEKQLLSVEAGDFLGNLKRHSNIEVAELTEIRRQHKSQYRNAMRKMSEGKIFEGIEILDKEGKIFEGQGNYLKNAASSYIGKLDQGESALIVAPTWREINMINSLVRNHKKSLGKLNGSTYTIKTIEINDSTKAQKTREKYYKPGMMVSSWKSSKWRNWQKIEKVENGNITLSSGSSINIKQENHHLLVGEEKKIEIQKGDQLLIQATDKRLGLKNGDIVSITDIDATMAITVLNSEGQKITIPKEFRRFSHGYAVTSEKSQGTTVDSVIVAGSKVSGRRIYVSTSRGRKNVEVHIPDKSEFLSSAKRGIEKRTTVLDKIQSRGKGVEEKSRLPKRWEHWHNWIIEIRNFMRTKLSLNLNRSINSILTR